MARQLWEVPFFFVLRGKYMVLAEDTKTPAEVTELAKQHITFDGENLPMSNVFFEEGSAVEEVACVQLVEGEENDVWTLPGSLLPTLHEPQKSDKNPDDYECQEEAETCDECGSPVEDCSCDDEEPAEEEKAQAQSN